MITNFRLQHFRSYSDEAYEFNPGVNIIVGPNASGKTNLLEAVLLITRGSSYRASDHELVQFKKSWARIEADTATNDKRIVHLKQFEGHAKKQFKINNQSYQRLSLQESLPVVLFEPNHLQLLSGAPELRRQFLDDLLEQTLLGFSALRRQYKRALAQRNALLKKDSSRAAPQLFAWNISLSELGGHIVEARLQLVEQLNERLNGIYNELAQSKNTLTLAYHPSVPSANYATNLLHKLETHSGVDFERGFTAYGPHREDLKVLLNSYPVQEAASRGETRTFLLVLKILEAERLEQARDMRPILLLDDVFSELDGTRRQALTQFLHPYQTFITTTDADVVIQHFTQNTHIIPLSSTTT